MKRSISVMICLALVLGVFCACSKDAPVSEVPSGEHPQVEVKMKNGGSFVLELYPEYAPQTVENFLTLVNDGFYDGLVFHRVVDDFMAQGGGMDEAGNEKSAKSIKGEFSANGFAQNTLSHTRGIVSMARTPDMNSASSQFFICYSDKYTSSLDGSYAAFGKVIKGMEVIDAFCDVPRDYNALGEKAEPIEPIIIESALVIHNS